MKKAFLVTGALLLTGGLYFYISASADTSKDMKPEIEFKTADVIHDELVLKIAAKGVVEPNFQVEVKSKASGEVLEFPLNEGDQVIKGQPLIRLDKSDELRSVSLAEADLASSTANLRKAESSLRQIKAQYQTDIETAKSAVLAAQANLSESSDKLRRQSDLFKKKVVSQEALDSAETEFKVNQENLVQAKSKLNAKENLVHDISIREHEVELARAEVQRSEIALAEKNERLQETEIYAPIDGVIIEKLVEEGQIIASGISNVGGGTALANIADLSRMFIMADIDETDIGQVEPGQAVQITADAFLEKSFRGRVLRIAPQGVIESSITIFKVKIEILGEGKTVLKPKMTSNVDIIIDKVKDALYIPREAVRQKKGGSFVAILNDEGMPEEVPVTTGLNNPIHIEIKEGLNPGQKVVLGDWEKTLEEALASKDKGSTMRKILWMIRSR
ncbi:MAG: efflux RND transporter periplasmic adaptor subunit [Candidatus Nitrohelix vancouverensis]|uniref:Efflux RND transporter periplasmic adaptor subunit n=1 Tax=Candidatus Nitrohelix vancouverensis TaxID=2705534 RepID=A0A7T0G3Y1_9BACT|nr:MAG: efflux RND transporter periplasmic adaptor subunit [Candidatus Nitrohelix vancouverensis]